jgi:site-specific DNA-cytosine methylase
VSATLKANRGKDGSGADLDQVIAAPLTKGSAAGEGVNQPGRRQEDDVNIVPTIGWQWHLDTGTPQYGDISPTLDKASTPAVGVRRLTPTECERLQGLPDDWTQLGGTPDSRRYSALGDAVTANVAEWIGRRLSERPR